jgi:hypothetical protein
MYLSVENAVLVFQAVILHLTRRGEGGIGEGGYERGRDLRGRDCRGSVLCLSIN